ncbi:MAG: RNA polymerase sigma factor [Chlorobiaceae bacterium]|nr:RNA polymerase sigma factor [Chlorobiaceae bacterium]NTW74014.1 RNA polymerase sigma factor [Chlorobiaceae bacterium]
MNSGFVQQQKPSPSDQQLVTRALGDRHAFAELVSRYEAPLMRYVVRLGCRNTASAQDLLQEIFIKTYLHLNDYDHSFPFSSWIYRIAHNEIISFFRKEKIRPAVLEKEADLFLLDNMADDLGVTGHDHIRHTPLEIQAAADGLDAKYREVIVLKFFEEKSYQEISDILQIPEGTVATLINRAKKKIKTILEKS